MKCGIVILNYNSYDLSCEVVKKALDINLIDKVVLIDNNSNDNFDEFINEINNGKIKYIKNTSNSGYATGNNIGLKYLKNIGCKYAFIANPDVVFEYNTIKEILEFLENNDKYGVTSCVRTQNGTKNTGQFWTIPTYTETLFESIFIGRKYQSKKNKIISNKKVEESKERYIDVEVVGGAFFGCNLEIMQEVDYLDEGTFLWYEENILSFKLRKNGYKVALLKTCTYEHNHKKGRPGNPMFKTFIESKRHYCKKYIKIGLIKEFLLYVFDFAGTIENKIICKVFRKN